MNGRAESEPTVRLESVHRVYHLEGEDIHAINGVTMDIWAGKMTAIVGRSGAGKTTLLNLIAGLDRPTQGEIWLLGQSMSRMPEKELLRLRREKLGFVFQSFGLLPLLTAAENVGVPLRMRGLSRRERERKVAQALEWVGLTERAHHRPYELSGGEQQRVAIARALASDPELILADEPTGQLDSHTGMIILRLLRRLVDERGVTLVIVSHDPAVREEADVVYELRDGHLISHAEKVPTM